MRDLLSGIKDIDGQTVGFDYDALMRLKETSARSGLVKTTYTYDYGTPEEWQGGNKITTLTTYPDFPAQLTRQYFDGLGRPLDTWRIGYGPKHEDIVAEKLFYDNQGRVDRKNYMPDIKAGLEYTRYTYEKSPLNRLLSEKYLIPIFTRTKIQLRMTKLQLRKKTIRIAKVKMRLSNAKLICGKLKFQATTTFLTITTSLVRGFKLSTVK